MGEDAFTILSSSFARVELICGSSLFSAETGVIVTVLTEVMAFWYKEMAWQEVAMIISLVLSLACIRIIAVRFSPRRFREEL